MLRFCLFSTILGISGLSLLPIESRAHGGEDHGDQRPKTTANAKGIISHSTRLGELEVMVKHPALEPNQSAAGRIFITRFDTNEAFKIAEVKVEIESASGSVFPVAVEAGDQAGTYNLKVPALPQGSYTIRTSVSHDGETDTATFSGIDVKPAASPAEGETAWFTRILIGVVFSFVIFLLFGLVYFVWRAAAGPGVNEEAFSV